MSDRKAASVSLRPRGQQTPGEVVGGLGVVVKEAGEAEDVEVLDFDADDVQDVMPEAEGEVIEAEDDEDCAPRRVAPDPGAPSQQDIDDHEVDHMPYRCWCPACVEGRGHWRSAQRWTRGPSARRKLRLLACDHEGRQATLAIATGRCSIAEDLGR